MIFRMHGLFSAAYTFAVPKSPSFQNFRCLAVWLHLIRQTLPFTQSTKQELINAEIRMKDSSYYLSRREKGAEIDNNDRSEPFKTEAVIEKENRTV